MAMLNNQRVYANNIYIYKYIYVHINILYNTTVIQLYNIV